MVYRTHFPYWEMVRLKYRIRMFFCTLDETDCQAVILLRSSHCLSVCRMRLHLYSQHFWLYPGTLSQKLTRALTVKRVWWSRSLDSVTDNHYLLVWISLSINSASVVFLFCLHYSIDFGSTSSTTQDIINATQPNNPFHIRVYRETWNLLFSLTWFSTRAWDKLSTS